MIRAARAAALAGLLLSGCASPHGSLDAGLDVAGGLAMGMLEGAGHGALGGLRIVAESRCDRRECLAIVPVAVAFGAVGGGLAGAMRGLEKRNDARHARLGVGGDVDLDGAAGRLERGELAVEK